MGGQGGQLSPWHAAAEARETVLAGRKALGRHARICLKPTTANKHHFNFTFHSRPAGSGLRSGRSTIMRWSEDMSHTHTAASRGSWLWMTIGDGGERDGRMPTELMRPPQEKRKPPRGCPMASAPDLSTEIELVGVPHTQVLLAVRYERLSSGRAAIHKVWLVSGGGADRATSSVHVATRCDLGVLCLP